LENSLISVLVAAINEEEGIGLTLKELDEHLDDPNFLVVDGNSDDKTAIIAKEMGAHVIYQEGYGKGSAISQGLKFVNRKTKYLVFIDADFTYPAKFIPSMIQILESNPRIGMVTGNRFSNMLSPRAMNNPFYAGNRFLAIAQHAINGIKLTDPLTGLRVLRWEVLKNWVPVSIGFDIEAEMNHHVERMGYEIFELPIVYRSRVGEKKLKLKHGFSILLRIIMESLSYHA
jgi:dolichol-phosphate hexosyltransferase